MIRNAVNAKYDSSYRNGDNNNTLLGRRLNLGQACGIIGVALYGPDVPLEDTGFIMIYIFNIFRIHNIFFILCVF